MVSEPDKSKAPERQQERDTVTVALLAARDPEGLARLLGDHGGLVRACLRMEFGNALDDLEIDEAMNSMVINVWRSHSFDATKGTLRAWATVIARNCALQILRLRMRRSIPSRPDLDHFAVAPPNQKLSLSERERQRADLHECMKRLPPLQRAVLQADFDAGCSVPAEPLAKKFGTTTNSIYVSRQKARKALREAMRELGHVLTDRKPGPPDRPLDAGNHELRAEQG